MMIQEELRICKKCRFKLIEEFEISHTNTIQCKCVRCGHNWKDVT